MNLVEGEPNEGRRILQSNGHGPHSPEDHAAAAAAAPASYAADEDEEQSLQKRTWDRIASHVSRVAELHEENQDDFHVEFANDAIRVFQGIISGRCIPGPLINKLHTLCHSHAGDETAGTQALVVLGRSLRKAAESRNEQLTMASGLTPGRHGLPLLLPPKPPLPRTASEERSERQLPVAAAPRTPAARVFDRDIKQEEEEEDDVENLCFTRGTNNPWYVDCSFLKPYTGEIKQVKDLSELHLIDTREVNDRVRPLNMPYEPYEYRTDMAGNVIVKSEMMGDDEFFDHQVNLRRIGAKYEKIASRGIYEERFIMKHIGTGYERKRYECDQCGIICANQHKYASHVRHAHPKTPKERAEIAKMKAERAAEIREEKRRKQEMMPKIPVIEREKRERRTLTARRSSGTNLLNPTATTAPVVSDKIYVCPICNIQVNSQHVFASHMRYNHPKDGTSTSMVGRRATVKRKKVEDTVTQAPVKMDTPEKALNALSAVLTVGMNSAGRRSTKVLADGTGAYQCRVCARRFENLNACAGHTRHCIAAHGAAPSPPKPLVVKVTVPEPEPVVEEEIEEEVEEPEEEEIEDEEEEGPYRCRVCHKTFTNPNSVAGHTRHCLATNGGDPSPRALARRQAKGRGKAPLPTVIIKTEPLPPTTKARPAAVTPSAAPKDVQVIGHIRKKPVPPVVPAVVAKAIKVEPVDDFPAPPPPKPVGRQTRNSAATALDLLPPTLPPPPPPVPQSTVSTVSAGETSARRATRASLSTTTTVVTHTPTPAVNGAVATPSSSRPSLTMSTRSSRSSARLMSPVGSETVSPPIVASTMPPPAKRARNASGYMDREIKRELMDEGEDETTKANGHQKADKVIKQEVMEVEESRSPKKRQSRADKKLAKLQPALRGLETEAARSCYYCHVLCSTFHAGDRHIRIKHQSRDQIYSCSECNSTFFTLGGLDNHWSKSEHCPQGFVMIAGQSIFDYEEEVRARSLEEKQNGIEVPAEKKGVADEQEIDVVGMDSAEEMKEKETAQPAEKIKKSEKIVDKRNEKVVEKKEEKKIVEKKEEKKPEKPQPVEKKPVEKVKKEEKVVEKKVEKPVEKKEDKKNKRSIVEKAEEKKEEVKVEEKNEDKTVNKKEGRKSQARKVEKTLTTPKVVEKTEEKTSTERKKKVKEEEPDDIESPRAGPSTAPAIISIATTRSGANRTRKPADRFDPDPTSSRHSLSK